MALPTTSYARRLASASQPVIITQTKGEDGELFAWLAERAWLGALAIASVVGVLLINSASAAATQHHHVGHAPKALAGVHVSERHAGHHAPVAKPVKPVKAVVAHRPPRHR